MRRILVSTLAVIAANATALILFWMATSVAVALSGQQSWPRAFADSFFLVGLFGTAAVSVTIFPISLVMAYLGLFLRWTDRWIYVGGGVMIGLVALAIYGGIPLSGVDIRNAFLFIGIGAICGWIYWGIAIRTEFNETSITPELNSLSL
jgi:hypothetical protein